MRLTERGEPEALFWAPMTKGIMLVEGLPGAGKSLFMVVLGYMLRKLFGIQVCMDFHPRPAFGDYNYIGAAELVKELEAVNIVAKTQKETLAKGMAGMQKWIEEGPGSYLQDATLLLQEGYRYFDKRRPMDKLLIIYSYLVQQWRHYQMLMVVESTQVELLDSIRFVPYITHWVKCSWFGDSQTAIYQIEHRQLPIDHPGRVVGLSIDASNWGKLYHSWNPILTRDKWLKGVL